MKNLYEGDPLEFIWSGEGWQALLWVFVLVFGILAGSNVISLVYNNHDGKYGITKLPTNMIGDSIVFPVCGLLIWYFYNQAQVEEDNWLVSVWPLVIGFCVALVLTALFVIMDIGTNGGNWITLQHPREYPNPAVKGYNVWGWVHAGIFFFVAYFLATAGVKATWYLITVEQPIDLILTYVAVLALVIVVYFGILVPWDRKGEPPFWYYPIKRFFHNYSTQYDNPPRYELGILGI